MWYLLRIESLLKITDVTTLFREVKKSFIGVGASIQKMTFVFLGSYFSNNLDTSSFMKRPIETLLIQIGLDAKPGFTEPMDILSISPFGSTFDIAYPVLDKLRSNPIIIYEDSSSVSGYLIDTFEFFFDFITFTSYIKEIRLQYDIVVNKTSGIYMIECILTELKYIGSSVNMRGRLRGHINSLRKNNHHNPYLQSAYNKYGEENFICSVLEICSKEKLIELETSYSLMYLTTNRDTGFNLREPCDPGYDKISPNKGKKMSEEQKKKISDTLKGRKIPRDIVEKAANSRRGKPSGMTGKKISEETRKKLSEAKKGKKKPPGFSEKISIALKNYVKTPEHCANISKAKKGKKRGIS